MKRKASLLLIEDNEDILAMLYEWLEPLGYELDCARNGKTGLEMATSDNFDCIVLDIMLPGLDGLSLCRSLRQQGRTVPVLILTARDTVDDRVAGLEAGADDYLVKPFALSELEARIRALLRRAGGDLADRRGQRGQILRFADLECDEQRHSARRQGRELQLSPTGFLILSRLLRAAPGLVRREELEAAIWRDEPPGPGALRTHIHALRRVLDKPFARPVLETVSHVGYRLRDDLPANATDANDQGRQ